MIFCLWLCHAIRNNAITAFFPATEPNSTNHNIRHPMESGGTNDTHVYFIGGNDRTDVGDIVHDNANTSPRTRRAFRATNLVRGTIFLLSIVTTLADMQSYPATCISDVITTGEPFSFKRGGMIVPPMAVEDLTSLAILNFTVYGQCRGAGWHQLNQTISINDRDRMNENTTTTELTQKAYIIPALAIILLGVGLSAIMMGRLMNHILYRTFSRIMSPI